MQVEVPALSSALCETLDFSDLLKDKKVMRETYLEFSFLQDGEVISSGTVIFTRDKYFEYLDPAIKTDVKETEDAFIIQLKSEAFARYVELDLENADCKFSDNYFDLSAGELKEILVKKESLSSDMSLETFAENLKVRSIYDIA